MKVSNYGGFYCSKKTNEQWCEYKADNGGNVFKVDKTEEFTKKAQQPVEIQLVLQEMAAMEARMSEHFLDLKKTILTRQAKERIESDTI